MRKLLDLFERCDTAYSLFHSNTVPKTLILILVYVCSKRLSCRNTILISNSKTCRNTNYTEMNSKKIMQEQVLKIIQYLFLHNYNNDPTCLYWWSLLSRNSFLHHLPSTWSVVNTNLRYLGFGCTTLYVGVPLGSWCWCCLCWSRDWTAHIFSLLY